LTTHIEVTGTCTALLAANAIRNPASAPTTLARQGLLERQGAMLVTPFKDLFRHKNPLERIFFIPQRLNTLWDKNSNKSAGVSALEGMQVHTRARSANLAQHLEIREVRSCSESNPWTKCRGLVKPLAPVSKDDLLAFRQHAPWTPK
jgi:hypothetical protein